jgi:beta-xylosidase
MTILESRDLVNWKYTGHAIPSLSWDARYNWDRMDGYKWGNWAGDLVYRDGEWLCYQIDFQYGLTMTRAKDIHGPWSEPVTLLKTEHGSDPAVYFDEETKNAWLIFSAGHGSNPQKMTEQKLFKLSWDGTRILDEGKTVYTGHRAEAAKLRRFNNQWYIMLIEWRNTGGAWDRKQLCLRSLTDSPYGPYESRVVFQRENTTDRSACQGSLIQAPDGSWWFMHQLVQNGTPVFQGRPQCLQPVEWKDGWPVIGSDPDGDGIGIPVWQHRKPIASDAGSAFALATSTEFDAPALGAQWNWNHNPRNERWSLTARPGRLRITASRPVGNPEPADGFWKAPNTLSQRHLGVTSGQAETRLDLAGFKPGMFAGLCHFSDRYALCGIREDSGNRRWLVVSISGKEESIPAPAAERILLRSRWTADRAAFSWSTDGDTWHQAGTEFVLTFGNWRGDRIGLFCYNSLTDDIQACGHADFDRFRHSYSKQ